MFRVNETLQNINVLLASLFTKSNTQLREMYQLKADLAAWRDHFTNFNDSVWNLQEQLSEHQEQANTIKTALDQIRASITTNKSSESDPRSTIHTCGGTGGWRRVVYLDMTDPSTSCPSGWQLTGYSKRTCGKVITAPLSCDSVTFPVSGGEYNQVCGRIKAYQYGHIDAFQAYYNGRVSTIDGAYVTGVSVTHGIPRQHIWTFAAGATEIGYNTYEACPCDSGISTHVPPFVGDDYFCESGVHVAGDTSGFQPDDPLWDGQNCTLSSTCCSFNTPPYFVKQLPYSTTDSIEARLCGWERNTEDSPIEMIELYVQ